MAIILGIIVGNPKDLVDHTCPWSHVFTDGPGVRKKAKLERESSFQNPSESQSGNMIIGRVLSAEHYRPLF